jgi:hypothetical protein
MGRLLMQSRVVRSRYWWCVNQGRRDARVVESKHLIHDLVNPRERVLVFAKPRSRGQRHVQFYNQLRVIAHCCAPRAQGGPLLCDSQRNYSTAASGRRAVDEPIREASERTPGARPPHKNHVADQSSDVTTAVDPFSRMKLHLGP